MVIPDNTNTIYGASTIKARRWSTGSLGQSQRSCNDLEHKQLSDNLRDINLLGFREFAFVPSATPLRFMALFRNPSRFVLCDTCARGATTGGRLDIESAPGNSCIAVREL